MSFFRDTSVTRVRSSEAKPKHPKYLDQGRFFDVAASRHSDPQTSRQAAERITQERLTQTQETVLEALRLRGPCTDEQLVDHVRDIWPDRRLSPQSIRSRRAELVRKGLVADTGLRRLTQYGQESTVWSAS